MEEPLRMPSSNPLRMANDRNEAGLASLANFAQNASESSQICFLQGFFSKK